MKKLIWGTGRLIGKVIGTYIDIESVEAFIDNDASKKEYMGKKVYLPQDIVDMEFDAILVVNLYSNEILAQCKQLGIDLKKVIFVYNNCDLEDKNKDYAFVERVVGKDYAEVIKKRYSVIRGVEASGDLCLSNASFSKMGYQEHDYVRAKSFELVVKEMRKRQVTGEVAELGVFRGEFSQYLNHAFPDKKLYLFDTFDGFDANEALNEMKDGNCTDAFIQAYKQTNISQVLEKMENLDNIIIKQGFFPQSLDGLEEKFAFVSIDVDFGESIYEGLKYFYPRVSEGGYIFVHDYNSSLLGVEKAVDRFEKELDGQLHKMPLCDANGTLVIMK